MQPRSPEIRVAVHSAPRSGSSWLGQILDSAPEVTYAFQPLFSYAFKGALTPTSSRADVERFFAAIAATDDPFVRQVEQRARGVYPRFTTDREPRVVAYKEVRYHEVLPRLLAVDPDLRGVALIRDPRAVIHSWASAPREFRRDLGWEIAAEWRHARSKNQGRPEEWFGFERWVASSRLFLDLAERHPQRFLIVRYGDLVERTEDVVGRVFAHCGLAVGPPTRAFLDASRSRTVDDPYAVFRSSVDRDAWRGRLPDAIARSIEEELAGTPLERFLDA